jgi:hypothetical protein
VWIPLKAFIYVEAEVQGSRVQDNFYKRVDLSS